MEFSDRSVFVYPQLFSLHVDKQDKHNRQCEGNLSTLAVKSLKRMVGRQEPPNLRFKDPSKFKEPEEKTYHDEYDGCTYLYVI